MLQTEGVASRVLVGLFNRVSVGVAVTGVLSGEAYGLLDYVRL